MREVEYVGQRFLAVSEEAETVGEPGGGAAVEGGPGLDLGDLVVFFCFFCAPGDLMVDVGSNYCKGRESKGCEFDFSYFKSCDYLK